MNLRELVDAASPGPLLVRTWPYIENADGAIIGVCWNNETPLEPKQRVTLRQAKANARRASLAHHLVEMQKALEAGAVVRDQNDPDDEVFCERYDHARPVPGQPCGSCRACLAGKVLAALDKDLEALG